MRKSYHDIKAEVLDRIRKNVWPPGSNVPGEIDLAEEFACARATVNRAMRELVAEGILERKRKAGTRVKRFPVRKAEFSIPLISEEIAETGAAYRYVLVDRSALTAPGWLRGLLGLTPGTRVLHLACMHYAGDRPYQFEDRWINLDTVPEAESFDFDRTGPNEWLVSTVPFTEGTLMFSATQASAEVAGFLDTTVGDAIFLAERITKLDAASVTYARLFFTRDYKMTTRF